MISFERNKALLIEATECLRELNPLETLDIWWKLPGNVLLSKGRDVGMATFEADGIYDVHWYFQDVRGRAAINLGKEMIGVMFDQWGAKVLRGYIRTNLRASAWCARQIGMKSYGVLVHPDGVENELFIITRDEYKRMNNG